MEANLVDFGNHHDEELAGTAEDWRTLPERVVNPKIPSLPVQLLFSGCTPLLFRERSGLFPSDPRPPEVPLAKVDRPTFVRVLIIYRRAKFSLDDLFEVLYRFGIHDHPGEVLSHARVLLDLAVR
ncbi:hypothetical protein [Streptomyces nigra]|uniref:hypothetical protein n=1 Tax=Streptomyces nigra TaxID=1827580 RepID=UPI0035E0EE27